MPHDIIDNQHEKLVDAIRRVLPGCAAARFAVGYFFLSGLEAIADQLANVHELRLLIGNVSNRETIEQIAEGYRRLEQVQAAAEALQYPKRATMEAAALATAQAIGQTAAALEQTDAAAALISTLVRLVETGRLKVRVYTQGRLHAKAYIFDYPPGSPYGNGMAIVGSSNFTLSGISTNTELNVKVHGDANHAELTRWFEALWAEAQEFEAHLMQELRQSWPLAEVTPYELYLKTLYELVQDQLEGTEAGEELLWPDDITAVLTEFQERAVLQAVQMIRRYGGCFVADVVGLGKSYIGAAIVKHFERHDRARALIICPAPLVEMWEHYNEVYQLNARVLSMGLLHELEPYGAEWLLHDERYRHRDLVLVDESHHFRNPGTQRYRVLQSFLADGERRVVLLTATPRNKSVWDLYHQLKLFHPADQTRLPVDPPDLRAFFQGVEAGQKQLPALLAQILIRRTRAHILRWYGYDAETGQRVDPDAYAAYQSGQRRAYVLVGGRRQFFPRRELETVEYSIENVYGGFYNALLGYLTPAGSAEAGRSEGAGEGLTFARYGLWPYVRPDKQGRPPYNDLRRAGANLRGLLRVMLFKRLESSVYAFRATVQRMLLIHQRFLQALDQGIVAAGEEAQTLLYESDQDEEQALGEALAQVTGRYAPADFDIAALRADVVHDIGLLRQMLALVQPITPERDAKLLTLQARLAQPPLNQGKVLIFTQFADTAQYLYDQLSPGHAQPDIAVIYSRDKSKAPLVARFAPQANPQLPPVPGLPELQTLIATDVLSEGLNLQDCHQVINYDLHWNPVRLIQRLGRIDRIGSEHERIYAYNFLPETALERTLGLRERLTRRIQEIHATIGEDAAILEPGERLNEEALYAIYTGGDLSRYEDDEDRAGEVVDLTEALELIRQVREDQPALYRRITGLRDGVRCGYANGRAGGVVLCRAGRYRQLYQFNAEGEIISRDIPHLLYLTKCPPATPAAALPAGHNARVTRVRRSFEHEVRARQAEHAHTLALTPAQRYVLAELRVLYAEAEANLRPQIAALDTLLQRPLTRPGVRAALNRLRRERLTGHALLEALLELVHRYGLAEATSRRPQPAEGEEEALPLVVCSEGWGAE